MKGSIQRFPSALLPLLSIKAAETPSALDDTVVPTLDMLSLYLADRWEVVTATTAGLSAVGQIGIPVPAGEYWYVHSVEAIGSNPTVGGNIQLTCGIADTAGLLYNLNSMPAPTVSIATQGFSITARYDQFLRSGMQVFAGTLVDPGAGTVDLLVRAWVARLQST